LLFTFGLGIEKTTLKINPGDTLCFTDILNEKTSYKLKYQVLGNETLSNGDDLFEVYLMNESDKAKFYSNQHLEGFTTIRHKQGVLVTTICARNGFPTLIKVRFEISSGLDVNDFNTLPFHVAQFLTRMLISP